MSPRRILLPGAAFGVIALGVGCTSSTTTSRPITPTIPPFAATVSDLVKNHTNDSEGASSLESLKLDGADVEDIHEFDALLGI